MTTALIPKKIADTISYWFTDTELLTRMSLNAKADGKPMATINIAKDIGKYLFKDKTQSKTVSRNDAMNVSG